MHEALSSIPKPAKIQMWIRSSRLAWPCLEKEKTKQPKLFYLLICNARLRALLSWECLTVHWVKGISLLLSNGYKSNNRKPSLVAIGTILTLPCWQSIDTVRGLVAGASTTYQL